MATSDEVVEADLGEHDEVDDPIRPGIRWCRDWWPDGDLRDAPWGELGVCCKVGHPPYRWWSVWDEFSNAAEEAEVRAELEAAADAHLLEAHAQLSLFEHGCGCR